MFIHCPIGVTGRKESNMTVYDLYVMANNSQSLIIKKFEKGIIFDGNIESIPISLVSRKIAWFSAKEDKLIIDIYEEN